MPTALIVEDEPEANKLLSMLVKLRGFQTVSAFTGNEAIEKASVCSPDVVFLDLMLPDINGYEVCRKLKSRQPTSAIPVVIVTARVAADNRLESFSNGADDYIPKPYTPDQIFDSLAKAAEWKHELSLPQLKGKVSLEQRGSEALRELARLRSLVLARTPLSFASVEHLFDELQGAVSFLRQHDPQSSPRPPLVLSYQIDPLNMTIKLHSRADRLDAFEAQRPLGITATIEPNSIRLHRSNSENDCLVFSIDFDPN